MASPDIQITNDAFLQFAGDIFRKNVLAWNLRDHGVQVRLNVNAPQPLTRLSAKGNPRPYSSDDHITGNGPKFTDRVITAYQSKWDWDWVEEEMRNTYLAEMGLTGSKPLYEYSIDQMAREYFDHLIRSTLYSGVRDANGDAPEDITDGWGTLIAAAIVAGDLTAVATGAITSSNAVSKVEELCEDASFPIWMREKGFRVLCSYATIDKYKTDYRTLNGFQFKPNEVNRYQLDNKNGFLCPVPWMGTSGRLIATIDNNLVFGTDLERIAIASSIRRDVIEVRQKMPVGCQIQDLDAIVVNDQA